MNAYWSYNTPKGSPKKGRTFVFCWPSVTMHLGKNSSWLVSVVAFTGNKCLRGEQQSSVPQKGFSDLLQQHQTRFCRLDDVEEAAWLLFKHTLLECVYGSSNCVFSLVYLCCSTPLPVVTGKKQSLPNGPVFVLHDSMVTYLTTVIFQFLSRPLWLHSLSVFNPHLSQVTSQLGHVGHRPQAQV